MSNVAKFPIKKIRTIALVGQAGSGKTSLASRCCERGIDSRTGSVERGIRVATTPWKNPQHSLNCGRELRTQDHRCHLSTPRYPISLATPLPALAAWNAAIVINAQIASR